MYENKEEQTINSTNPITLMLSYEVETAISSYAPDTAKMLTKLGTISVPKLPQNALNGRIPPVMFVIKR